MPPGGAKDVVVDILIRDRQPVAADQLDNLRVATNEELNRLIGRLLVEKANAILQFLVFHDSAVDMSTRRAQIVLQMVDVYELLDTILRRLKLRGVMMNQEINFKFERDGGYEDRRVLTNQPDERVDQKLRDLVADCIAALYGTMAPDLFKQLNDRAMELGCLETAS